MPVLSHGHPGEARASLSVFAGRGCGREDFSTILKIQINSLRYILYNLLPPFPISTTSHTEWSLTGI